MSEELKKTKYGFQVPSFAFIACLLISAIGWCILNFSKEYRVTLDYTLVCSELPEGKKSVITSDTIISLTFYTRGLNYLNSKYSEHNRVINVPISELIKNKPKRSAYTFSNKEMRDFLIGQGYNDLMEVTNPEIVTFYLK
ncbi:MAG: hypothetical protein RR356_00520 [Bacteroidales bacterium]